MPLHKTLMLIESYSSKVDQASPRFLVHLLLLQILVVVIRVVV